MKNLKRAVVRRAICVLLTAAMLCADTEVTVYAAEGAEQKVSEGTVEETQAEETVTEEGETEKSSSEETPVEEVWAEDGQAEDDQTEEPSEGNDKAEGDLAEEGEKEESSPEEMPTEENSDVEADESVSENDIEDVVEDLTMAARDAEDGVVARGEYKENGNDITWVLDSNGKLTVEGAGDFADSTGGGASRAPWYDNRELIKSVEVNVKGMTNGSCMFFGCRNLEEVDLSHFDTGRVTDMNGMFELCESLTSLDLNNFDTGNVTDMYSMFGGCESLTSLDLKNFDTSNVTDMGSMFYGCRSLTSLDIKSFDTGKVTDMGSMFYGCESLTSLDVKNFDTGKVTEMIDMFGDCESLTSLDIKNFDTGKVTDMSSMFDGCESLTSLDLTNFDTSNVTDMYSMFGGCWSLASLDLKNFDTSNVTDMHTMFVSCSSLTSIDVSSFDTGNVTTMSWMFEGCSSLTSIDVSSFDTGNVSKMNGMFSGCERLTSLDLSGFDVSKVLEAQGLLLTCFSLSEIRTPLNLELSIYLPTELADIWYQQDGTPVTEIPKNLNYSIILKKNEIPVLKSTITASKLKTVYNCEDTINTDDITVIYYDADGKGEEIKEGYTTDADEIDMSIPGKKTLNVTYNEMTAAVKLTVKEVIKGNYGNIDWSIDADGKLTVTGTGDFCGGYRKAPWNDYRYDIISAEIDVTDMTDASDMFYDHKYLTSVDFKTFNSVTNMRYMFYDCRRLTSLDLTKFDTGKVTDMNRMFYGCESLTSLDVKNFDTGNVTDMGFMFYGCRSLTSLDVKNFDTGNVTDMGSMFYGCRSLTSLDVKNFDTGNVTDMGSMFYGCRSLTSLDIKSFDIGKVTDMNYMFDNCSSLTILDLGGLDLNEIDIDSYWLSDCENLTTIYTPLNLKNAVALPGESTDIWYQADGTKITELPQNLNYSILIGKNKVPVIKLAITVTKTKTTYVCGETVNIDDLTVIYYGADGKGKEVTGYSTNADQIDMSTPGTKSLVITYQGLQETVELIVKESEENPDPEIIQVAVPVANPESGRQLIAGSKVTLTCETAGAEINYTTADSEKALADPTEKSTRYTEPIVINEDMYIKAAAIKGDSRSKTVIFHYTVANVADKVLKPYAVPGQGTVESGTKVELKCDTPDAAIYYVTGKNVDVLGAVPADDDHKYTGPIEITGDMVIKAISKKDGMKDSDFSTFAYKIKLTLDPPAAAPISGTVARGSYISLSAAGNVNIYYTMDQSDPTTSGSAKLYESRIRVDGDPGSTMVIKAAAEKNGVYSKVATFTYTVSENTVKGLQVMLAGSEKFTYTGSAITPAVIVTNNGEVLTEGENYTVRYSNNVKAADKEVSKAPKITITGKGNLTKSASITFSILPKDIGDEEEVVGGNIVVVKGKTASPVLYYGGVKLTAKDFENQNAKKKYDRNETITISGKGNFKGTRDIDVKVVEKLKKFTVVIDNQALKANPLIYDGEAKKFDGYFKVYDTADKNKATPLEEYSDYAVIYPRNITNAGKVKFTVVGLGEYCGTVTKTYTIQPKAVKTETDSMKVNMKADYPYKNGGVVIPDLTVTCGDKVLVPGKDYKVFYSNNKKICTDNRAKCTISFMGNYKGSKALVRNFNITPVNMNDAQMNGSASVVVGDMVYTGKPGAYKSVPYVTVNGVLLKSADYTVSCYKDSGRTQLIDGKTASGSVDLTDSVKQIVYVKIEGKGNYTGVLTAEYDVCKLAEDVINLAKAKVSFVGENKAEYTGEGVKPEIEVMYKSGREWKKVDANDIGTNVTVTYINNVNKGKATVMINGSGGKYAGSKTAVFSIVPKSIK